MRIWLAAVLLGAGGCSAASAPKVSGPIGVVRFSGSSPWVKQVGTSKRVLNDNPQYVVRKTAGGELLFAVKQGATGELQGKEASDFPVRNPGYDFYSDTRYAVSLATDFGVRPATLEEWAAAKAVVHSYHFIRTSENPLVTKEGVKLGSRVFGKSGESWGTQAALVSPRGAWIAVLSYTSPEKAKPGLMPGIGGSEPGRGDVFVDLYDASSGKKVATARAPYGTRGGGFAPSILFSSALWIEDRYFILPIDSGLDACLVGVLPDR